LGKSHVIGEIAGQAKIVSDSQTDRVVGAHIIGAHATELIAEATLAIRMAATVEDLATTIHAHPTLAEIMAQPLSRRLVDRCTVKPNSTDSQACFFQETNHGNDNG
jgi:dihydrolipoamide dehydrogenase